MINEAAELLRKIPFATVNKHEKGVMCTVGTKNDDFYIFRLSLLKEPTFSIQVSNPKRMYLSVIDGQLVQSVDELKELLFSCVRLREDFPELCFNLSD